MDTEVCIRRLMDQFLTCVIVVYPDRCTLCLAALGNSGKVEKKLSFWDDVYGETFSKQA